MIWFTADSHFGHMSRSGGVIKLCNRPFSDIDEMDNELIMRWNECVEPGDTIYHIGDFCFSKDPYKYLKRLAGRIVLINGSHDKPIKNLVQASDIVIIKPIEDEYGNPRPIVMCHYAMRSWYKSHYASWHLFGHHHGKLEPHGLSFDVGVDTNNFYPYSLDDVIKKMRTLKPIVDYRK